MIKFSTRHIGVVLLLLACCKSAGAGDFVMPDICNKLETTNFVLIIRIPESSIRKLPKALPVYQYSSAPFELPADGLQELIDLSAFKGTNISELLLIQTNTAVFEAPFRLATSNKLDYFTVDPERGGVMVFRHTSGVNPKFDTPAYDTIPSFDSIKDSVLRLAQVFGVSTNDMERKDDGTLLLRRSDATTVARGGAVKYISRRSVGVSRCVAGYTLLGNDEKVEMTLGPKGVLQQFQMKWRRMNPVSTNRVFKASDIANEIKNGDALVRVMNEYPEDGVAQITLKDIRIQYFVPLQRRGMPAAPNTDITPVA